MVIFAAALQMVACQKPGNEPEEPKQPDEIEGRDAFIGEYSFSTSGSLQGSMNIPMLGNQELDYPISFTDRTLTIKAHENHADSVIMTIDSLDMEIKGEVVGNKLLINPTKMDIDMAELAESMGGGMIAAIIEQYFAGAELEIRMYHSTATLEENMLSFTTDLETSLEGNGASVSVEGTLNNTAVKK